MNPNYPTLTPPIANQIWFDVDAAAYDEETEVNLLDAEYQDYVSVIRFNRFSIENESNLICLLQLCAASQIAAHIQPLGKTGLENPDAPDLSDEDDGMGGDNSQLFRLITNSTNYSERQ